MERVLIIGCGGSGKSTLAKKLGEKTGLPVIHMDRLFWQPGWTATPDEVFEEIIEERIREEYWIMDGDFIATLPQRLQRCDTVIYLDMSRVNCLWGAISRLLKNYGKVQSDMGLGCPESFDPEFLRWVWQYNKNNRPKNYRLLQEAKGVKKIILKNRREVRIFLESI
jgi:adenylate kinase family enzyme